MEADKISAMREGFAAGKSIGLISRELGLARSTVWKYLRADGAAKPASAPTVSNVSHVSNAPNGTNVPNVSNGTNGTDLDTIRAVLDGRWAKLPLARKLEILLPPD